MGYYTHFGSGCQPIFLFFGKFFLPSLPVPLQQGLQILACEAARHRGHLLRGAGGDHFAAGAASLGAQVDDIVGALDEVQIVRSTSMSR